MLYKRLFFSNMSRFCDGGAGQKSAVPVGMPAGKKTGCPL